VTYLVSDVYNAPKEHGINPLDEQVGLVFPAEAGEPLLSPKDTDAPSLAEAAESGLLPSWEDARAFYDSLNAGAGR
jgi:dTDP-4-dehydrorhamnose 3,5-epimerase